MIIIDNNISLDFSDVLIKPRISNVSSRKNVRLLKSLPCLNDSYFPIIASNMEGVGTFKMVEKLSENRMLTCLNRFHSTEETIKWINDKGKLCTNYWIYSMGISNDELEKFNYIYKETNNLIKIVAIDIANGYLDIFINFVKNFHEIYPNIIIIAGNVIDKFQTRKLFDVGATFVKVGIGSGSVCTTRIVTGVGYPQLSSIIDCKKAVKNKDEYIISDGGCTTTGDIAKAFAAGADFVMLGNMLSGFDEGLSEKQIKDSMGYNLEKDNILYNKIPFYGNSSKRIKDKHYDNNQSIEGKEVLIDLKGPVIEFIKEMKNSLQSTCSYVGCHDLLYLTNYITFVRVNNTHNKIFE